MNKVFITGGAGFIGINTARYFSNEGWQTVIFDNFSRKGSTSNLDWLTAQDHENIEVIKGDIRTDTETLRNEMNDTDLVIHLAGQVAVTTSVEDPRFDFETNALGSFNVFEAARTCKASPVVINASTNKVYGGLEDLETVEKDNRYNFRSLPFGVSEKRQLDFHSPYGCSKGIADQYARDYYRIYGLRTVVFRQSCIYGPRQFGIEDQGWLAWFIIAKALNRNISIYGNGKQVRDILYIDDLVEAYMMAYKNIEKTKGEIYNIGGGPDNAMSIWYDLKPILEDLSGSTLKVKFDSTRPGDQPIFVSDIRKAAHDFDWEPKTNKETGISRLYDWVQENKSLLKTVLE